MDPTGLALNGNNLYVANGEGDTFRNGAQPGTFIVNPAGFSSPLFSSGVQFSFSRSVDQIQTGFTLTTANHHTLVDGNPVTLTNSSGDTATVTRKSAHTDAIRQRSERGFIGPARSRSGS